MVALAAGRITVSVHRGEGEGLFRVVTPQATLTVTGTVFTVAATFDQTHLSVSEGTVRLAVRPVGGQSQPAAQLVSAGRTFTTDGHRLTRVHSDDTAMLLAAAEATADPVAAIMQSPWYKQRFAPLLHLRDYLTDQGVEVDELTLLAISADLWCIQYPKDPAVDLPPYIHRKAGLERAAAFYGYEVEWLAPADGSDASAIARRAMTEGELVLLYGRADRAVETPAPGRLDDLASSSTWQYRFLGEEQPAGLAMCRISRSTDAPPLPHELARQALADMRDLLAGIEDPGYVVGQTAARVWARAV